MRYAIVSDIHANLQAWNAVLKDIEKQGADAILCLGDVIGYGPNPAEVLDSCYEKVSYFVLGNHDAVVGNRLDSNLFNDSAKFLIDWTSNQLTDEAVNFFKEMPLRMEGDGFVCAHGELALPGRFSYIHNSNETKPSFNATPEQFLFVGHTHLPAKFKLDIRNGKVSQEDIDKTTAERYMRYLINAGSVGDPRDGGTEASYCIFDQDKRSVTFHKVAFDIASFKESLNKVKLPSQPYFLSVFDGMKSELQTMKDMQIMDDKQVEDASIQTHIVSKETLGETNTQRLKVNFSTKVLTELDDHRDMQREEIVEEPKKNKSAHLLSIVLAIILLPVAGALIYKVMIKKESESIPVKPLSTNIVNDEGTLLAYEGFIYNENSPINKTIGKGFGWKKKGRWEFSKGNAVIHANSLKSDKTTHLKTNGLHLFIESDSRVGRFLDTSAKGPFSQHGYLDENNAIGTNGKTLYISFIFQPSKPVKSYEFELHLKNLEDSGKIAGIGNDLDGNLYQLRTVKAQGQDNFEEISIADTKVNFFVMRIDYHKGNDDVHVFHNPPRGAEPPVTSISRISASNMSFNGISLAAFSNSNTLKVDEIRIGTSYRSVTPTK